MRDVADGGSRGQRPGEALIAGGFGQGGAGGADGYPRQRPGRSGRSTVRVAAPLAVPVALAVTLGVILAVSTGPAHTHVTQGNSGSTSSSAPALGPSPAAP